MGAQGSKVTVQDRAILQLKVQRDKLKQYKKRIQIILDREHEIAKECLRKGEKEKALRALRRKKYQEQLLDNTDKHLETLEELTQNIEFSLVQKDVFFGLKQGNEVLKAIHKEMSLESVEKLMEETAEAIAYQKEVDEILAGSMSNQEEDEVEEEFERLASEEKAKLEPVPVLPSAPQHKPVLTPEEEQEKRRRQKERARERREQLQAAAAEETREAIPA